MGLVSCQHITLMKMKDRRREVCIYSENGSGDVSSWKVTAELVLSDTPSFVWVSPSGWDADRCELERGAARAGENPLRGL